MDFTNHTGIPAQLIRTAINETRLAAALVARITYKIEHNDLIRDDAQPWIVSAAPWDSPEGPMASDEVLYRGGVDLFVFGKACAFKERATASQWFRIRCNNTFNYQFMIFGDRYWDKKWGSYIPSDPELFIQLPLTLQHAFGGKDIWDGLEIPFPENPEGKGFSYDETNVLHRALPNLEDPDHLIQKWDDRPSPVGVGICPQGFGPRLRNSVSFDEAGALTDFHPSFFNAAFPAMVVPSVKPGDSIVLEGVAFEGPMRVNLPPLPLTTRVTLGNSMVERPLYIDQIGIQVEEKKVFITYRYPFRYDMIPKQKRVCELVWMGGAN